jgi:DNA-binding LacI/PurR family transcriptional regulator
VGIRKLARDLRLSIGTVSRALNDRPDVNPETRARVKAAAAKAGYVPNQSGRSLRSGRTGMVAVVIPACGEGSDSGLFHVLEGARRTLRRSGLDLIVLFRGEDEDPVENLQRIVQRRIVDAVIISQTTDRDGRIAYLKAAGIDYVAFGRAAGVDDYLYVDMDFEAVGTETARLFIGDGHRRIALATGEHPVNYQDILAEIYAAEARRLGLHGDAVRVIRTRNNRLTEADRMLFADTATAPTAVLASHEHIAAGLYADFAELGREIGRDVSLVCTFPAVDTRALKPALSYFDADLDSVGRAIAERLIGLLPERRSDRRILPPALTPMRFTPRQSHGPAPGSQSLVQAPFLADERTQASTKATPATPSPIVG